MASPDAAIAQADSTDQVIRRPAFIHCRLQKHHDPPLLHDLRRRPRKNNWVRSVKNRRPPPCVSRTTSDGYGPGQMRDNRPFAGTAAPQRHSSSGRPVLPQSRRDLPGRNHLPTSPPASAGLVDKTRSRIAGAPSRFGQAARGEISRSFRRRTARSASLASFHREDSSSDFCTRKAQ